MDERMAVLERAIENATHPKQLQRLQEQLWALTIEGWEEDGTTHKKLFLS